MQHRSVPKKIIEEYRTVFVSVADPDVFGPSRSGSRTGSFFHQAKKVRKTLIPYCFVTSLRLLIFKNDLNVPSKVISRNK
jgi:hypothetical protein